MVPNFHFQVVNPYRMDRFDSKEVTIPQANEVYDILDPTNDILLWFVRIWPTLGAETVSVRRIAPCHLQIIKRLGDYGTDCLVYGALMAARWWVHDSNRLNRQMLLLAVSIWPIAHIFEIVLLVDHASIIEHIPEMDIDWILEHGGQSCGPLARPLTLFKHSS